MSALSLVIGAVTITSDGSTDYELEDWDPGAAERVNAISTSEVADGGSLNQSHRPVVTATLVVRVTGTDVDDAYANAEDLAAELDNGGDMLTIVEAFGTSTSLTYDCFPAKSIGIPRDALLMEESIFRVVAKVDRQP